MSDGDYEVNGLLYLLFGNGTRSSLWFRYPLHAKGLLLSKLDSIFMYIVAAKRSIARSELVLLVANFCLDWREPYPFMTVPGISKVASDRLRGHMIAFSLGDSCFYSSMT